MNNRKQTYDILRIIAILFVLYNHRVTYNYFLNESGIYRLMTELLSIICKCGSPLFFMLSGALLIKKDENLIQIFKHRIARILIVMFLLSVFLSLFVEMYKDKKIYEVFLGGLNWYLYSYLAFLVLIPLIRAICKSFDNVLSIQYIIAVFLIYSVQGICIAFNISESFSNGLFLLGTKWGSNCWHIIFPITGYILVQNKFDKRIIIYIIAGTLVGLVVCLVLMNYDLNTNSGNNLEQIRQHFIYLPTCSIFLFVEYLNNRNPITNEKIVKIIQIIAASTFGVFLVETHTSVSQHIYDKVSIFAPQISAYFSGCISIFIEFVLYVTIITIFRMIPYINKVL